MTDLLPPSTADSSSSESLDLQGIPGFRFLPHLQPSSDININNNRKRRPAGTPDPDAEVVALSPKTLMESDKFVCEICNQGFQRDQNLQMHRRSHKVPWKLLKKSTSEARKRVYVCPHPTCLHNDPCHALGDLVGIKKHFLRKHSIEKQWKCEKCSKGYAVQSDYKAHLKTCGTRGHLCDCGRVFSRVESFISHQDHCEAAKKRASFGCIDPPSLLALKARTRICNETLNSSGFSSIGKHFYSNKLDEHQDMVNMANMEKRELQFVSPGFQSYESEATVTRVRNGHIGGIIKDYIRIPRTEPRSKQKQDIALETTYGNITSPTVEEEDMPQNGAWLQLSIGPCMAIKRSHN
ncbi:hypothetical protein SUGI_0310980 [Cryptomeria japonica]|uniref:protein indeterminate-domain 14 n=1 Tax=Cryptomeria japonica TaxID=3369 RepID=UPI002408BFB7|nr:protein indeterminate-domain 14 [Cryptomeria japonica]GLJ17796.1 hypothetical protein SUGI_0310980 [Cryptomeria japonica]